MTANGPVTHDLDVEDVEKIIKFLHKQVR